MNEEDQGFFEMTHAQDVNCFFQLVLGSLPDHFDIHCYDEDFPFA